MGSLEQIKLLNLTEADFKLLVDGLEALPERGIAGEMLGDLLINMLEDKANPDAMAKTKAERENKKRSTEQLKEAMKEEVKILQGKLLMLKRYLQENKLLKDAYEILDIPK